MVGIIVILAFFGALVVGSLVARALGRLPTADELQEEDRVRFARYERSL